MTENRSPEGGFYLPFQQPSFSREKREALLSLPFHDCVAEILNLLFQSRLTGTQLKSALGSCPVRIRPLGHRTFLGEMWNREQNCFAQIQEAVFPLMASEKGYAPGNWFGIAMGIAVLAGMLAEMNRAGETLPVDICVVSGDFSGPIGAYYARQWGLPVGNILCCCNENSGLWELLEHGRLPTAGVSVPTAVPEADVVVPENLERLIFACGGVSEVRRYLDACRHGKTYCMESGYLSCLRQGLRASVVSSDRAIQMIPAVYRTHGRRLSPGSALAYGCLMDHRARTGEIGTTLILSENHP